MRDLKDIINEAIVKHNIKHAQDKNEFTVVKEKNGIINFPVFKHDGNYDNFELNDVKQVNIGKGPFYIYKDNYHKLKHIICFEDLALSLGQLYYDFEDFDESFIIKDFPTLKEAVVYALKDANYNYNKNDHLEGYYDHKDFIDDVLHGKISDKYYINQHSTMFVGSFIQTIIDSLSMWTTTNVDNRTLNYIKNNV